MSQVLAMLGESRTINHGSHGKIRSVQYLTTPFCQQINHSPLPHLLITHTWSRRDRHPFRHPITSPRRRTAKHHLLAIVALTITTISAIVINNQQRVTRPTIEYSPYYTKWTHPLQVPLVPPLERVFPPCVESSIAAATAERETLLRGETQSVAASVVLGFCIRHGRRGVSL